MAVTLPHEHAHHYSALRLVDDCLCARLVDGWKQAPVATSPHRDWCRRRRCIDLFAWAHDWCCNKNPIISHGAHYQRRTDSGLTSEEQALREQHQVLRLLNFDSTSSEPHRRDDFGFAREACSRATVNCCWYGNSQIGCCCSLDFESFSEKCRSSVTPVMGLYM